MVPSSLGVLTAGFVATPAGQDHFYEATRDNRLVQSIRAKVAENMSTQIEQNMTELNTRSQAIGKGVLSWDAERTAVNKCIGSDRKAAPSSSSVGTDPTTKEQKDDDEIKSAKTRLDQSEEALEAIIRKANLASRDYKRAACAFFRDGEVIQAKLDQLDLHFDEMETILTEAQLALELYRAALARAGYTLPPSLLKPSSSLSLSNLLSGAVGNDGHGNGGEDNDGEGKKNVVLPKLAKIVDHSNWIVTETNNNVSFTNQHVNTIQPKITYYTDYKGNKYGGVSMMNCV